MASTTGSRLWLTLGVCAACSGGDTTGRPDARADGAASRVDASDPRATTDVTVPGGPDADAAADAPSGTLDADTPPDDGGGVALGPMGGSVDRLRFGVFGDIRPPLPNQNSAYPTAIVEQVMAGLEASGAQFAVASGDYLNANFCNTCVDAQLDLLVAAERQFRHPVFHAMGNHECLTVTTVNCPNENESAAIRAFKARLAAPYAHVYYDFMVRTSLGDAHFVATAPNAWNDAQRAWLDRVLALPARYTFVLAHEPPDVSHPSGSDGIERAIAARAGGVTLRLYGHTHHYAHPLPNAIVSGNAGAPLEGAGSFYGFVVIQQRADANLEVTAYEIGSPPMVRDSFVLTPDGTLVP